MIESRRKNEKIIGLLLEDIGSDFSKELVKSIVSAIPANRNIRIVVLPGKHIENSEPEWLHAYKRVYNTVFGFADTCDLDGFIIHLGSLSERDKANTIIHGNKYMNVRSKPMVFVASDMKDYVTVNYDNEAGIREAVEYLVNVGGVKKLCMLGGRDNNKDARARKAIFACCLAEYGISFREKNFVHTDMTANCEKEAGRLLDNNPDVQAVFCVNDAVAKGLYDAMKKRDLVPGRDIQVFGFDNTRMSSELIPALTSIGAESISLGQRAFELLLAMLGGIEVKSAVVPTRLYGRASLMYDMHDYTTFEMVNVVPSFVYRVFDDIFYRYKSEYISREMVDLRRLFYEILSRMLFAMKRRYMSEETFEELGLMIDKFFEKGAMDYTDAGKLLKSIQHLQDGMNDASHSMAAVVKINRLFLRMKDKAICALAEENTSHKEEYQKLRTNMQEFIAASTADTEGKEGIFRSFDKLGIDNAALYVYEKPLIYDDEKRTPFPEYALLRCVVRSGELYLLSNERRRCPISELFSRSELPNVKTGYATFPVFCGDNIYGLLLCGLTGDIYDKGEYIASQIGRSMRISEKQECMS
ncbi:DNA-binding transcriptional regulator, LacI/PurR family [Ruminococcus sp. YE71]|uniref:LacI family DNA-binding transcriptional regulator n=1 Tax=unclassified Ruminococcus TaxID=2608920 RepID=UPI00088DB97F|nr:MULTISPECIES: substrate-binding domain-containing protein [unclassified Ruminococcus]SDA31793.1 DNA-binding transcriptional regulator, LacI/PurR family [Ruminococcus sp. YE78]SFW51912.1 DNA-binding transcriptional regulator, LacI/PurR family [Ruminococcus sp. YE71]